MLGPTFRLMGYSGFVMYNRTRTRAWTGYDNAGAQAMAGTRNSLYTLHQVEVLIICQRTVLI